MTGQLAFARLNLDQAVSQPSNLRPELNQFPLHHLPPALVDASVTRSVVSLAQSLHLQPGRVEFLAQVGPLRVPLAYLGVEVGTERSEVPLEGLDHLAPRLRRDGHDGRGDRVPDRAGDGLDGHVVVVLDLVVVRRRGRAEELVLEILLNTR